MTFNSIIKNHFKKNIIEILLFITGFILSFFIPQMVGYVINKLAQYIVEIILFLFVFLIYSKRNARLNYLLGGILTAISFQIIRSSSHYITTLFNQEILAGILVLTTLILLKFLYKEPLKIKFILYGIILFIAVHSIFSTYKTFQARIENPSEWDFLCYYLNGKVADQGLNFYEPQSYVKVFDEIDIPIKTDYGFYRETVEVALQYFPQSIFLFVPLGFFDFITAHLIWDIFLIFFLIIDIYIARKIFFHETELTAYLFVIPLFLLFRGVWYSLIFESYAFIMLFILLLIWKEKNEKLLGLWLSIGIALKPIMLIFILFPILRKKWKVFLYTVLYTVISIILTIIFFGTSTVFSFFTNNTIKNLPYWSYIDGVNQSLLPTILRLTHYDFSLSSPIFHPIYLITGFIITIITFWLVYKLDKSKDDFALAIFSLFALIIYPSTLNHYMLLAIPSIFYIINKKIDNSKTSYFVLFLISISYLFMHLLPFYTVFILWLIIISLAIYDLMNQGLSLERNMIIKTI